MIGTNNRLIVSIALISEAFLFVAAMAGCGKAETSQMLVSEAREYQKEGKTKAAIIQLKNALQKNPEDPEARYLLGVIYQETGDSLSAEKELRKALSLGVSADKVVSSLAKALLLQGQFQKVLDEAPLPKEGKPDPELLALRGDAYLALGRRREAKESFELALRENPDFGEAIIGLARHALLEKDDKTALTLAEKAVSGNSKSIDVLLFHGDLLRAAGKTEGALASYGKAIEIKPDHIAARISKAFTEITAGKFDAAKADIDAARKADPKSLLAIYTEALLEFSQGKHANALESIQQVLRVAPDHMPSVLLAGAVQYALGSTQQAEQHLKKYLEKVPGNRYASKLLVAVLLKNGDSSRALKVLNPMLKDAEKDPQLLSLAGESYMRAKDYAKATEYFEKASAVAPEAATIRTALGMSRLAQGENAQGVAELEAATKLDAKSTQAGILLVMTHTRLKEYDKALAVLTKMEKAEPDNPLLHNLRGGVYLGKADLPAARTSFEKAVKLQPKYFPAVANLAQIDIRENRADAARKRLQAFLEADKKNVDAMMALAGLALSEGRKDEATALLERASNEKPDDIKPAALLAMHYLRSGEKQKAAALAQKLQTNNPTSPEALDLLAQTQFANNDTASALQSYKKLVLMAPSSALAHFRVASVFLAMNNQDAAADALKNALSLKPDYVDAQFAMATLEVRRGKYDQALKIAKQIQKQSPKTAIGYALEGDILMTQKKPEFAVKAYEAAYAVGKNGPVVIKLHESLKQSGKAKEGDVRLSQWLKENPSDTLTRMYFATASFMDRQNRTAIEQYQAVLQVDPKNFAALNNLALAYQQEKDPRAIEAAEKAFNLAPENPLILDTYGWMLAEQGNLARGLPLLEKASSLAPGYSEIRYHLAQALLKQGDKAKARKELEQLLTSPKFSAKADEARTLLKQLQ